MWIKMLETFTVPPHGIYLKGMKYDVPEDILKQIRAKGRRLYEKAAPPWLDASILPHLREPAGPAIDAGEGQEVQDEVKHEV
jgi:hypothetical protein